MRDIQFDVQDEDGNVLHSFTMRKMTVGASARKFRLYEEIQTLNVNETQKNHMIFCASIVCVLADEKNEKLLFPPPDNDEDHDDGVERLYSEIDEDVMGVLTGVYQELNQPSKGLVAKKK